MEQHERDRAETARVMHVEAQRLRALQDSRIRDIQQRSITLLSLVATGVTIVAGLSASSNLPAWSLWATVVAFVGLVASAVVVHIPKGGYREGPNIFDLNDEQYQAATPGYRSVRDVAMYHYDHWQQNNRAVLRWINWGFASQVCFAAAAVVFIVLGAAS